MRSERQLRVHIVVVVARGKLLVPGQLLLLLLSLNRQKASGSSSHKSNACLDRVFVVELCLGAFLTRHTHL